MTQAKYHSTKYVGIDPGKGGGIAMIHEGIAKVFKCPASPLDMATMFELIIHGSPPNDVCVMMAGHLYLHLHRIMGNGRASFQPTKSHHTT